jgi:hypothetical protein
MRYNAIMIEHWHEFFVMVGGAAAVLTGLVFVAMSLNLERIVKEITHKSRAIGTLAGFTGVFVICALALAGDQSYQVLGIEWIITAGIAAFIYVNGAFEARKRGRSVVGLTLIRLIFGTGLYVIEILGASMLVLGYVEGLYIAAFSMVVLLAYTITGAWLLLVGVEAEKQSKKTITR